MGLYPRALTIAGSDPSGGAGIQADIKTFTALGVYGMGVITSLTVQNTKGVLKKLDVPPELVYEQIKCLLEDIGTDSAKTGMLSGKEIILKVAEAVREFKVEKLVVDTVIKSKNGFNLLNPDDIDALVRELFPLALLVTPNVPEAELLCGDSIKRLRDVELCARKLLEMGARGVLIKGGHMKGAKSIDVLYMGGQEFHYFVEDRLDVGDVHGTGCTLSSAITAFLARGHSLPEAVGKAKIYIHRAIKGSMALGRGARLPKHFWNLERCSGDF